MGHELTPKRGSFLPVDEATSRLRDEFRFVDVSRERARAEIDGMLKYGEQFAAKGIKGQAAVNANLRKVRNTSVMIGLADRKRFGKAYLSFLLKPEQPIFVDYEGQEHEDAAKPILTRVATALGYRITII